MKNNGEHTPLIKQFDSLYDVWQNHIPLVSAMKLTLLETDKGWSLEAPLQPNSNHMGTGFGGSLASIATLAGWAQTWMLLPNPDAFDIVVARSSINYKKPATGKLVGTADVPTAAAVETFQNRLATRGRGAINVTTRVHSNGVEAAELLGKFVAVVKTDA